MIIKSREWVGNKEREESQHKHKEQRGNRERVYTRIWVGNMGELYGESRIWTTRQLSCKPRSKWTPQRFITNNNSCNSDYRLSLSDFCLPFRFYAQIQWKRSNTVKTQEIASRKSPFSAHLEWRFGETPSSNSARDSSAATSAESIVCRLQRPRRPHGIPSLRLCPTEERKSFKEEQKEGGGLSTV